MFCFILLLKLSYLVHFTLLQNFFYLFLHVLLNLNLYFYVVVMDITLYFTKMYCEFFINIFLYNLNFKD